MLDIATITAFLGSIKTATVIAKAITLSGSSLEKAELKLKIAEPMESLANIIREKRQSFNGHLTKKFIAYPVNCDYVSRIG